MSKITVALGLAVLILVFFLWKGCEDQKKTGADTIAKINAANALTEQADYDRDSVKNHEQEIYSAWQDERDKWTTDSFRLIRQLGASYDSVDAEKVKFHMLAIDYKSAKDNKDTGRQLIACDSAFNELEKAKAAVTNVQNDASAAIDGFSHQLMRRDSTIAAEHIAFLALDRAYDTANKASAIKDAVIKQLTKTASQRFHLSVGLGIVANGKGVGPGGFIGGTYSIF